MIHYTSHVNWTWVLEEAIGGIADVAAERLASKSNLPSFTLFSQAKGYSLFRAEKMCDVDGVQSIVAAWVTSRCMEFLDPKDSLFREMHHVGMAESMPKTVLLDWDSTDEHHDFELPSLPALLKAPLGSGGDSLYFVRESRDVAAVIKEHAAKALSFPGFLDGLRAQYNQIPQWSLQEMYPSILVDHNRRKCQLRAYLVYCDASLYLYTQYEVRQPMWTEELSSDNLSITPMLQADMDFSKGSAAVPYNLGRSKIHTERLVLREVPELSGDLVQTAVTDIMTKTFAALQPAILAHRSNDMVLAEKAGGAQRVVLREMAIAGVDLLINSDLKPKIVELNNNPAMPAPHKHMTPLYKRHLVDFVRNTVLLGITPTLTEDDIANLNFIKVF